MPQRSESRPLLITMTVIGSLLVHIPVIVGLAFLMPNDTQTLEEYEQFETIELVEEEEEEEEDKEEEQQTVVSLDKPKKETEEPKDAKFLDRYNQKVDADKQTVRKRNPRPNRPRRPNRPAQPNRPQPQTPPSTPPKAAQSEQPPKDTSPPKRDEDTAKAPDQKDEGQAKAIEANRDSIDPGVKSDKDPTEDKSPPSADNNDSNDSAEPLNPQNILPNMNNTPVQPGEAASNDYLDVPEGEKDLVNRKRFRYWAFFDRMKAAVRQHWRPNEVYRRHDPRRQIYGVEDRLTILKVVLNGDGSLRSLFVEKPSGVAFLDEEAMRAFRAASPFPNPPEAIKDANGAISLRFGFFLNIQTRGSRIIRFRR